MNDLPACPWCHTTKHVQTGSLPKSFYCRNCRREFEADDDGTVGYGDPARHVERRERHKLSQQERNRRTSEGLRLSWAARKAVQR